ncbi:MAG TPA: alpha-L-fucosidase, partial [Streptomyces sp.]
MTFRGLVLVAVTACTAAVPAVSPAAAEGCGGPIRPASIMTVRACDSPGRIVAKAAAVVPRPGQLAWQQRPVTAFTHFGMNTFTDREWGSGAEKESTFAPPVVDTDQWMRSLKAAGVTQVMLTAKHHDGFVLYPTRYTNHSVVASPWWLTPGC